MYLFKFYTKSVPRLVLFLVIHIVTLAPWFEYPSDGIWIVRGVFLAVYLLFNYLTYIRMKLMSEDYYCRHEDIYKTIKCHNQCDECKLKQGN